ncbi:MAG: 1-deoxy-D-xylulose-5-phosphate reductoisomerase [Bacteroidetes bacterium]|jgi:1-deoxy-D-xylulose-5-phosphate reductoisomerase|nr:1-deoxy-D-xylulose-5-phosphate reductoisomerase [Bacteroidota bacterium]
MALAKQENQHIALLGSTGSIGTQALEVVAAHPQLRVSSLAAGRNLDLLVAQARRFRPSLVVIGDESRYAELTAALADLPGIRTAAGLQGMIEAATLPEVDTVLGAIVGFAGLQPTLAAIEAGKQIALANKETLVVAGELVMQRVRARGVQLLPVDSEHSAIFQCLQGEPAHRVQKLVLTASGGPFRGYDTQRLAQVSRAQALKHPNWEMGAKITIDSASMMNKGLEVIEARWLFDLPQDQIEVVVHPQSILHSLVAFVDGSWKAQLGLPDMRVPIQYALSYPDRLPHAQPDEPGFSFANYPQLTFEPVDHSVFRSLDFAAEVLRDGGNRPCVLNAANEVAVQAFLEEKIRFTQLYDLVEAALHRVPAIPNPQLEDLLLTDAETRQQVAALV